MRDFHFSSGVGGGGGCPCATWVSAWDAVDPMCACMAMGMCAGYGMQPEESIRVVAWGETVAGMCVWECAPCYVWAGSLCALPVRGQRTRLHFTCVTNLL